MSSDRFGYYLELPEDIRAIFMQLCQDLVWLHAKRDFFLELFFDQENAALLHDTVIQSSDDPLPDVKRDQIDNILQEANDILNEIYRHYVDGEISFKLIQVGDAKTLIHWLKTAKEYEEQKLRRLREGFSGFEPHR